MSVRLPKNNPDPVQGAGLRLLLPWRGLLLQLFLVAVLPLIVLLMIITFGSQALHQQAMRNLVGERDVRAIRTAAGAIEEQIRHRADAIRLVSLQAQGVDASRLAGILSNASFLQSDFDGGLAFFGIDGALLADSSSHEVWTNPTEDIILLVNEFLRGGASMLVTDTLTHPQTGERLVLILVADPVRQRVTAGAFSATSLARQVLGDALAGGHPTAFILVDRQQRVIDHIGYLFTESDVSNHPGIAESLRGESGATYVQAGNSEHVVAYSPVGSLGWGLVSEEPWEMVATPTLQTTQLAPLVLAPVLLLALVALWFGARQVVRPLQALEARANRLAWGDFQAVEEPVGGIAEIRRLQMELVQMARKVKAAQESLHGYIGAITAAQEDERRRLARELHDDTIQSLIALKQRVQLARLHLQDSSESDSLDELTALTEQTIENLRRLTRALRPIYLEDLGLVTALEMLAQETGQAMNKPVEFQRQGTERRLESAVELALYRMAQEALSNVARHAQASHASLNITFTARSVAILVTDNGQGFDVPKSPAEFAPGGHFGLLGLYERAELIGATLEIRSFPGKGTSLRVHLDS